MEFDAISMHIEGLRERLETSRGGDAENAGSVGRKFEAVFIRALDLLGLQYESQLGATGALWDLRPLGEGWDRLIEGRDVNIKISRTRWLFTAREVYNALKAGSKGVREGSLTPQQAEARVIAAVRDVFKRKGLPDVAFMKPKTAAVQRDITQAVKARDERKLRDLLVAKNFSTKRLGRAYKVEVEVDWEARDCEEDPDCVWGDNRAGSWQHTAKLRITGGVTGKDFNIITEIKWNTDRRRDPVVRYPNIIFRDASPEPKSPYNRARKPGSVMIGESVNGTLLMEDVPPTSAIIAIDVPQHLSRQFPRRALTDTSTPHVTLLVIGEVNRQEYEQVIDTVRRVAADTKPFTVKMDSYGEFPYQGDPQYTIVPHMEVSSPALKSLHSRLYREVGRTIGRKPLHFFALNKFKGHATLDYDNPPYTGPKPTGSWTVRKVTVWQGANRNEVEVPLGRPAPVKRAVAPPLGEEVSLGQLRKLESVLDALFARVGMDVEFSKHFIQRVNDARNHPEITLPELASIFREVYRKHINQIQGHGDDWEAVITDLTSLINLPFVLHYSPEKGEMELVAKTVMRKKGFRTRTKRIWVHTPESISPARINRGIPVKTGGLVKIANPEPLSEVSLVEAAKTPADLPPDIGIAVVDTTTYHVKTQHGIPGHFAVVFWNMRHDRQTDSTDPVWGALSMQHPGRRTGPCDGALIVASSGVAPVREGWGPLLYDAALEFASYQAEGLAPDRESVSRSAHRVWEYYKRSRYDVKRFQLDNIEEPETPDPGDDCTQGSSYTYGEWPETPESFYYHKGIEVLRELHKRGKLVAKGNVRLPSSIVSRPTTKKRDSISPRQEQQLVQRVADWLTYSSSHRKLMPLTREGVKTAYKQAIKPWGALKLEHGIPPGEKLSDEAWEKILDASEEEMVRRVKSSWNVIKNRAFLFWHGRPDASAQKQIMSVRDKIVDGMWPPAQEEAFEQITDKTVIGVLRQWYDEWVAKGKPRRTWWVGRGPGPLPHAPLIATESLPSVTLPLSALRRH